MESNWFGSLGLDPLHLARDSDDGLEFGPTRGGRGDPRPPRAAYVTTSGDAVDPKQLADQFILFQFNDRPEGPTILEASQLEPKLAGSAEHPDVLARLQLASFHIADSDRVDPDARATLRLDFGKDEQSSSKLDTLFWSVATGLQLYNSAKAKASEARDLKADFNEAFSHRPIEIPGGLAKLRFEVVRHRPPPWWKKVFAFLEGPVGQALTATVGFPAITTRALQAIDELVGRLGDSDKPEVLFCSRPLTLAMSEWAKREFTGGIPGIEIDALSPGFTILARGRDYDRLIEHRPVYLGQYGLLKPSSVKMEDFLRPGYRDPFADMTYVVIRVGATEAAIEKTMRWGIG